MPPPRSPEFQILLDNLKAMKEEATALGRDPIDLAKERMARLQADVLDMADVIRVLGAHGVLCPLCLTEMQQVCTEPCPSVESRQRSMVGAWTLGFIFGRKMKPEDEESLVKYGCARHENDLALMLLAAKGDFPGP